ADVAEGLAHGVERRLQHEGGFILGFQPGERLAHVLVARVRLGLGLFHGCPGLVGSRRRLRPLDGAPGSEFHRMTPPPPEGAPAAEGIVVRSTGSWYTVQTDAGAPVQARARGRFRLDAEDLDETNPIAVGDRVTLRMEDDGTGLITEIQPRRNQLSRRAAGRRVGKEHVIAANVDAAWCVQSAFKPKFNAG